MAFVRARRALPLACFLGLVAPDGFAPLGVWPLTLACLAALILLIEYAATPMRAFALGWWFGVGLFVVGLNWIATAFTFQANMPAWLGWVAVVLLSLYLALFTGFATLTGWWLWRRTPGGMARLATCLGAMWIVGEYLRATVFTGFAWNPLAAIWAPVPGVPQAFLPWIGTYGLSGLTILVTGFTIACVRALVRHRRDPAAVPMRGVLLPAIVPVAAFVAALLANRSPVDAPAGPLLRIVQPNIPQDEKWEEGASERNFARIATLTGRPGPEPRLILWSESVVPWYIEEDEAARSAIAALLGPRDVLMLGAVRVRWDAAGDPIAATNSVYGLDARGRLLGRYDKAHLVPYGEYLPMRPILSAIGISRLAPGGVDFDSGPGPRDIMVPGIGPVGVQLCYEITFSGEVVDRAHRPRFLFNPSNDGWFGAWGPPQHLAQARLRAIEEGLPVIRATPTGISAIVDSDGYVRASLPWRTAGAIEARLPPAHAPTLFARLGNTLPLALALLLGIAGFASRRTRG